MRASVCSLLCIVSLVWSLAAGAVGLHSLRFDHLGVEQGLPSTGVHAFYQTKDGVVWLGTAAGLGRHDGRRIRVFTSVVDDPASLSHLRIFSLLEDEEQHLWVGTRRGLDQLDLRSDIVTRQVMPDGLKPQELAVLALAPAGPHQLWVACAGGLYSFDMRQSRFSAWQTALPGAGAGSVNISAMLADGKGGVWFADRHTVRHIDRNGAVLATLDTRNTLDTNTTTARANPASSKALVRSLATDAQGRLWVGTAEGLSIWKVDGGSAVLAPLSEQLPALGAPVVAILQDHEHAMWLAMGQDRGLYRWRKGVAGLEHIVHLPGVSNSLSGNSLTAMMQDRSGTLWVGSLGFGVNLVDLQASRFTSFLNIPGDEGSLSDDLVTAVIPSEPQHAWVGTQAGGLNRVNLTNGDTERIDRRIVSVGNIKALLALPDGQLWVGGEGLQRYDSKTRRSVTLALGNRTPAGGNVNTMARDGRGDLWVGSAAGLYRVSPDLQVQAFHADPVRPGALRIDAIDSLLVDRDQRLWVGTKGGLYLWDAQRQNFLPIGSPVPGIASPDLLAVTSIKQDHQGRIWLATLYGLVEVEPSASGWRLTPRNNLIGDRFDTVESMQDAPNGDLWIASERGLTWVQMARQTSQYFQAKSNFGAGFNFGAAARDAQGGMLFGGLGLVYFHPDRLRVNSIAPRVYLTDILIFNQSLTSKVADSLPDTVSPQPRGQVPTLASIGISGALQSARAISLKHQHEMVSFEFSALQFYHQPQNRFAWKLEGYDRDWIYGQADQAIATYTNLNAGNFRLIAKAASPDGIWSADTVLLEVEVLPPYWQSWWWYLGWSVLVTLLLSGLYQWRMRSLRHSRLHLEQQVKLRTQDALAQKALAEEQRELAEKASKNIGVLSDIGRQITASLDLQAIQETLYFYVSRVIQSNTFGIGLVDWDRRMLVFNYVMHNGAPLKPYKRSLNAVEQPAIQCVLQGKKIKVDQFPLDTRELDPAAGDELGYQRLQLADGSEPLLMLSGLFTPLLVKGRVIGIMMVHSVKGDAFDEGAMDILQTLGAYTAVALDNADAYRRLQETQTKLIEQEKLAALGALVAGVAHELNTPIGNSLLAATTMEALAGQLLDQFQAGTLRRSALESFCVDTGNANALLVRNLGNASRLIASFKQIAVDQTSDQRRPMDLKSVVDEVALTLSNRLKVQGYQLHVDVPPNLLLDSYPGALAQVLTNLTMNAMVHGLAGRPDGSMWIEAQALASAQVKLVFYDNGSGISADHLGHIFEPFFTTRLGQGGSGLGLHICYNIVHNILGGSISVDSEEGQGARFTLILPSVAPLGSGEGSQES